MNHTISIFFGTFAFRQRLPSDWQTRRRPAIEEKARQEDNLTQSVELLNISDEAMVRVSNDNPGLPWLDVYFGESCRLTLSSFSVDRTKTHGISYLVLCY